MQCVGPLVDVHMTYAPRGKNGGQWKLNHGKGCCVDLIRGVKMPIELSNVICVLGPKLLLAMGCVKLGEKNCVHLPSVGEQTAN